MPILNMVWWWKKWGNIWEPLNLTVTSAWLDATITWEDNEIWTIPPTTFQKSELVRKIGSAPTSPSDWTLVVTETVKDTYKTTWYVDQWLTDWETYYYRVFSYSDLGGISYCDAVSVTISGWWQPWVNTKVYYNINDNDTNSTIYDLSWNWVDQTWSWTPQYTTDATYGRVAVFDWASQTSAGSIVNFGGELTCIALVKANSSPWIIFWEWSSASRRPSVAFKLEGDNSILFTCSWTGGWHSVNTWTTYQTNTWYMITGTRDSSWNLKIYINWTLVNTTSSVPAPNYNAGDNLMIGKRYWEPYLNWQFKLFIGENRTRTDQEIADLASEYGF